MIEPCNLMFQEKIKASKIPRPVLCEDFINWLNEKKIIYSTDGMKRVNRSHGNKNRSHLQPNGPVFVPVVSILSHLSTQNHLIEVLRPFSYIVQFSFMIFALDIAFSLEF